MESHIPSLPWCGPRLLSCCAQLACKLLLDLFLRRQIRLVLLFVNAVLEQALEGQNCGRVSDCLQNTRKLAMLLACPLAGRLTQLLLREFLSCSDAPLTLCGTTQWHLTSLCSHNSFGPRQNQAEVFTQIPCPLQITLHPIHNMRQVPPLHGSNIPAPPPKSELGFFVWTVRGDTSDLDLDRMWLFACPLSRRGVGDDAKRFR